MAFVKRGLLFCSSKNCKVFQSIVQARLASSSSAAIGLQNPAESSSTSSSELLNRIDVRRFLDNQNEVIENVKRRHCEVDLEKIKSLSEKLEGTEQVSEQVMPELLAEVLKIPNDTHPEAWKCEDTNVNVIAFEGCHESLPHQQEFHAFCKARDWVRTDNLGNLAGHRAYYLKGPLAELEQALIRYSMFELHNRGFQLISVPDVLYPEVVESMGMSTKGERDQVYFLETPEGTSQEWCLSGTAEMALGGFVKNRLFNLDDLPLKLAAVSRCYRAETSSIEEESGLFRVHYFTKVEMFAVTPNETGLESNEMHMEFLDIQQDLFRSLQVPFRVLEMPPYELGLSAHRKFDVEAWMPGKKMHGEISSCSNCTDFQSRRLNTRYRSGDKEKFVHTVNGTACAIPRMLISLIENRQNPAGKIELPKGLENMVRADWMEPRPKLEWNFLRTKSQQDRVTEQYD